MYCFARSSSLVQYAGRGDHRGNDLGGQGRFGLSLVESPRFSLSLPVVRSVIAPLGVV